MKDTSWESRNPIVANLLNPAFCGEIIRATVASYNKHTDKNFPYLLSYLVLPLLLHKDSRSRMPRTTRTYLFVWVEENDDLFYDFGQRTKNMVKYTKEAVMFLLAYKKIEFDNIGLRLTGNEKFKAKSEEDYSEVNDILKKAEMLGKWLSFQSDVKSIFSFFRITP